MGVQYFRRTEPAAGVFFSCLKGGCKGDPGRAVPPA